MALSVVVVAGPGWDPGGRIRGSLASVDIEVVGSVSISTPASKRWGEALGAVFVDKPSLGSSAVEVVSKLQHRIDASIVVLDDDPDPSDIIRAIMAGADLYVHRDSMADLVQQWSPEFAAAPRSAEDIVRRYAKDAVHAASRLPQLWRTDALSDQLLKSVMDDVETQKGLLVKAKASLGRRLLDDFGSHGVGEAPTREKSRPSTASEEVPEPPRLFWNTRFPDDKGILLHQPHLVVAQAEYLIETSLGPEPEPGAESSPQDSARLLNKDVRFRLEAENGEFRPLDSADWAVKAISPPMACTESGTDAFRVLYRAVRPGQGTIRAFLIVDNGSIDQQRIELKVEPDATAIEAMPRSRGSGPPSRSVARSLTSAPSPDYAFYIREEYAELWHHNIPRFEVKLPLQLAVQIGHLANNLYEELRRISVASPPIGDRKRPLRLRDADQAVLGLAKVGARLHQSLFRSPIGPLEGGIPKKMGEIAEYLGQVGDETVPPLLQIHASLYPLPWGLLYDRSDDGGEDLKTADDVDTEGFWGRRFDLYRSVIGVDREPQRGVRRWVKPVIGAFVPRGEEQREFLDGLRSQAADEMLVVQETSGTASELRTWVTSGDDSDLLYLFCHASPQKLDTTGSSLGFGDEETEALQAKLEELDRWWGSARPTNPIVFLNACSSGQQDLIYGAPFVEFFTEKWEAQAFVGTDWPINPSFADVFGRQVLMELLERRVSIRAAVRSVSDEAAADSNFFPLIYAIYGLNTVQFIEPASAA